nr:MAG TPA: hypothetical protein [Caudoviricetes sp.]DAH49661.1 MAG TPA: hypothetical protein [Caudoviricetes sp.]DAH76317.1 MAG TPA: hypothetical protein [Caudoviricetes sp.]DAW50112.1 MAG TPA: hypothetical protein [Caudoviricetes sp.]
MYSISNFPGGTGSVYLTTIAYPFSFTYLQRMI